MFKSHLACLVCLAGCVVCAACQAVAVPPPPAPTPAVVRLLDLSQVTLPPPPPTPTMPANTPTPAPALPTATPVQALPGAGDTATPGATAVAASTTNAPTPACRDQAEFVRHLSISPRTALSPQQTFGKVWQIRNTGSCTWTPAYSLVFLGGQALAKTQAAAPDSLPFPASVPPGATLDLGVRLMAPEQPGEYTSYWIIQAPNGEKFGLGAEGVDPLVVQIVVRDPNARSANFNCG